MTLATVSVAFVRSAVRALDAGARRAVLAEAAIDGQQLAQPDARVPAQAFARLWMAVARQLDDEFFGLDARRMKVGSFAMLCHALVGQRTVGAALRQALRGFGLLFDDIAVTLRSGSAGAALVVDNRIGRAVADAAGRADARRFADETLLVMVYGILCRLAGHRVVVTRLDLAHPQPAHADEYRRMFGPLLRFDAPATALHFDARVLQAESRLQPASLKAFLRDAPQSVFLKRVTGGDARAAAVSDRVRKLAREALQRGDPAPTLASLARALAQSPATLRRRLADEGATWQQLKDAERRTLALALLAEPGGGTVAEVAARLGYADASTLYRAHRKWTGEAPGRRAASTSSPSKMQ